MLATSDWVEVELQPATGVEVCNLAPEQLLLIVPDSLTVAGLGDSSGSQWPSVVLQGSGGPPVPSDGCRLEEICSPGAPESSPSAPSPRRLFHVSTSLATSIDEPPAPILFSLSQINRIMQRVSL